MVVCTQLTGDGLIRLEILLEPGKCFCVFKAFSELHDFMKEICEWAFKVWIAPIETRVYLGSNLYDPALKGEWIKYRRMNSSLTSCQRKIGQKWNVFLGLSIPDVSQVKQFAKRIQKKVFHDCCGPSTNNLLEKWAETCLYEAFHVGNVTCYFQILKANKILSSSVMLKARSRCDVLRNVKCFVCQ